MVTSIPSLVAPPTWVADERRIHHARLRPATPGGAWALQQALEDALRCACFDDFGRLVLVRRLCIGTLPPRCDSLRLTAALERAWRDAAHTAVPALQGNHDPALAREACDAEVVWFTSPWEAGQAALARLLDGAALDGWFWPRAVPLLDRSTASRRDIPALICALLDHLTADTRTAQHTSQAIARWPPARLQRLQTLQTSVQRPAPQHGFSPPSAPPWRGIDRHGESVTPHPVAPVALETQAVQGKVGQPLHQANANATVTATVTATPEPHAPHELQGTDTARTRERTRPAPGAPCWPWLREAHFTAHGGVLWLLNLLPAIGFGTSATPPPPPLLVQAVLAGLLDRAGVPPDDPQRDVLPLWPDQRPEPRPEEDEREARQWQVRARRALRRHAHLSLTELAQHPAWVTVTPTHADLVLPMATIDLRVRRCGLDRDPGWVPWLGRIVAFHFVAPQDWPEPENT